MSRTSAVSVSDEVVTATEAPEGEASGNVGGGDAQQEHRESQTSVYSYDEGDPSIAGEEQDDTKVDQPAQDGSVAPGEQEPGEVSEQIPAEQEGITEQKEQTQTEHEPEVQSEQQVEAASEGTSELQHQESKEGTGEYSKPYQPGEQKQSEEVVILSQEALNTSFAFLEDEDVVPEEDTTKYILVEETVMDDLGKEIKVKQKVPILREDHRFERVTIIGGEEEERKTHKFIETITRVIKKSELNDEGDLEERETQLTEVIEHDERPLEADTVYVRRVNEKGEVEEFIVPVEERKPEQHEEKEVKERPEPRRKKSETHVRPVTMKKVLKMVKEQQIEPCSLGKVQEVVKPTIAEIEVEEEESEIEDYLLDADDLTEEEQAQVHERMLKRREAKITKLKDNLRTVLVRLALAEKKKNLYMQLISISSEVKEDILNPPDPDKPSFKVPKKVKSEDKFRRMYTDKLMEYRELRSAILVKLAMEKKRKEEVKNKYDVIASEVAQVRKTLEDKLTMSLSKLLPKHDPVFKNQSPHAMVKRFLELLERLDNETKELMYKKKQMYLAKQKYDEVTENEQGLSYKYSLANKELKDLVSKNDRRNEKLESLKTTMQKECLAITHINQKCDAILKTTDEKNARLASLNQSLIRARQDRKDVHQARRKVETELKEENTKIKLNNHPSLLKEYHLVEELLRAKQAEFFNLKRECLSSLEQIKKVTSSEMINSFLK